MKEVLQVENLTKTFGNKTVVNQVSFSVPRGEIMGFLGPNGAGKTTSLRIIMGILNADRGNVSFYFNDKPSALDKTKIGYLPEEKGLYDDVKVLANLVYIAELKGMPKKKPERKVKNG